jgi:hypothetical protein
VRRTEYRIGDQNSESWWDPKSPSAIAKKTKRDLWRGRAKAASPVAPINPDTGDVVEIILVQRPVSHGDNMIFLISAIV